MVEDPVARIRMSKMVARETLDWEGQTYYFISAETRREFEKRHETVASSTNDAATPAPKVASL